jgi:LuxR family maltose regulon positive regulatory protein
MAAQAHLQLSHGRLRDADDVLRRALRFAVDQGAELLPAVGSVRIGLGELLYEWNDLDVATDNLADGMELAKRTGDVEIVMWGYIAQSRISMARGDFEGALATARDAEAVAQDSGVDHQIVDAAVWLARLYLMNGDPAAAAAEHERAVRTCGVRQFSRELERLGMARLLIARDEPAEALRLLDQLRERSRSRGRLITIHLARALALQARNDQAGAMLSLAEALALAEPEGYIRTFVDEGPPVAELLRGVLNAQQEGQAEWSDHIPPHYIRKLLADLEQGETDGEQPACELPELLSEREQEVLRLIAAGESNRRIADALFISVGTVKTHLINIYRKLDAHSRTQAVARARDLNLL